jgi:hypothetical protein
MTDWAKQRQRKTDVKARAGKPNHMYSYCRVVHCGRPARAGTGDGLDMTFCRSHADHYSRHGSPYKASYTAKELQPHRQEVRKWLRAHQDDARVRSAVLRVQGLYQQAGPHVEAFRLRGLPPRDRAWAAWARLRKANVDPLRVVEAWLAVEAMIAADPQPENNPEYKRVQVAKLIHRLASGTHKSWPKPGGGVQEMHVYPRSRGRVLRYMGMDVEDAAAPVHEDWTRAHVR